MIPVNTKNILFICGGAFDSIEKKIAARMNTMVVGFNASQNTEKIDRENFLQYIAPQDLKSFGLIRRSSAVSRIDLPGTVGPGSVT